MVAMTTALGARMRACVDLCAAVAPYQAGPAVRGESVRGRFGTTESERQNSRDLDSNNGVSEISRGEPMSQRKRQQERERRKWEEREVA